jgi:hypothetical protein
MDSMPENSYRSRYGIAKLQDHNHHTWAFQCQMLLSENKVWDIVNGKSARPQDPAILSEAEQTAMTATARKTAEKAVADWDERNEIALRIISFTVADRLQGPIHYGKTAKGAWDELQKVHAPKGMQRKYALMRRLLNLGSQSWSSISDLEETFDALVHSLTAAGKEYKDDELIIYYAHALPESFENWIQGQMALVDQMSITDFKGRVREEARRLISIGKGPSLGIDSKDPDTVQGNLAKGRNTQSRVFPPRKPSSNNIVCHGCGEKGHIKPDCPNKRIAEEYIARQVAKLAAKQGQGQQQGQQRHHRKRGKGGGGDGNKQPQGNVADVNSSDNDSDSDGGAPAYSAIFGGLAYSFEAATNCRIRRVRGVWVKDCGATHHMHHERTLFTKYHRLKHRLYVGGIGSGLLAIGIGDIQIKDKSGNVRVLEGVLHVPGLKNGLMSLNQLALKGWVSTIKKDGCTVSHGYFSIHSPITNGLCIWVQEASAEAAAFVASSTKSKPSLDDWHERLGHISKDTLIKFGNDAI